MWVASDNLSETRTSAEERGWELWGLAHMKAEYSFPLMSGAISPSLICKLEETTAPQGGPVN